MLPAGGYSEPTENQGIMDMETGEIIALSKKDQRIADAKKNRKQIMEELQAKVDKENAEKEALARLESQPTVKPSGGVKPSGKAKYKAPIITDTITRSKSKRGGKTTYTITAKTWNGEVVKSPGRDENMNVRMFQNPGVGKSVVLGTTESAKEATRWVKEVKRKGQMVEMEVSDLI